MKELRITIIGDGSSDKTLKPIINWLLKDKYPELPVQIEFADFRNLIDPPKNKDINGRINCASEYFPFDILVYHRDAEGTKNDILETRKREVLTPIPEDKRNRIVCAVPIKMMETWLLIDKNEIKKAAGNRNYSGDIDLPKTKNLESIPDPKNILHESLKKATGASKRRLSSFNVHKAVHLVAENIKDYKELRALKSFETFETDFIIAINRLVNTAN